MLQKPYIRSELHSSGSDDPKRVENDRIHKTGICLAGYRHAAVKSHLLSDHGIQAVHLVQVSVKELQEGRLRSCRSLAAQKLEICKHMLYFAQSQIEFLHPQCRSLAYGCRLRGLEVRKSQGGKALVFVSEFREFGQHVDQLAADQSERLSHDYDVRIVAHIAAGGAQVNDSLRLGALQAVCIDMAHDIVTHDLFSRLGFFVIDIVCMRFQLRNLLIRDGKAEFLLCLCQRDP